MERHIPQILDRFKRIYNLEKEIFSNLQGCLSKEDEKQESKVALAWTNKAKQIDLTDYFNNRAFVKLGTKYESGLLPRQGYDEFIYYEESIKIPIVGEIYYQKLEMMDNICCFGQRISIVAGKYRQIAVVGCCFPGGYDEVLRLQWSDGSVTELEIGISDIHSTMPTQGDRILYTGMLGVYSEGDQRIRTGFEGHIFLFEKGMSEEKVLTEIQLPDFKFMHIFAIVLE